MILDFKEEGFKFMTIDQKKQIIQSEIDNYEAGVYMLTIRAKVAKTLNDANMTAAIVLEMTRHETALDTLKKEMAEIKE